MGPFDAMKTHGYGEVHLCHDAKTGLQAIVAIHDTTLGPALGGCRFLSYPDDERALLDALRLARAMSAKAALAGLAHGGGKAVIMRPAGRFDREALFQAFGRFVQTLGGRYITTEDSGSGIEDMEAIRRETKHVCGFGEASGGSGDPSPFTALGVRRGIEACVELALGLHDLQGVRVAVQGVGHVGYHLCRELRACGATLVVADVDAERVARVVREFGASAVDVSQIHAVECDVFAPCALGGVVNDRSLPELRCKIVAGAANNQLEQERHAEQLMQRGIVYAPDYAINAGGLINVAQEVQGYDAERARERTLRVYDTVARIIERAKTTPATTQQIADAMVRQRLDAAAEAA